MKCQPIAVWDGAIYEQPDERYNQVAKLVRVSDL
jgi:hypothetical protein